MDPAQLQSVLRRFSEAQRQVRFLVGARDGRSLTYLATQVEVSSDTVERLMSGRSWPSADLVGLLAAEVDRPLRFTRDGFDVALAADRERLAKERTDADTDLARQAMLDASADAVIWRLTEDLDLLYRVTDLQRSTKPRPAATR